MTAPTALKPRQTTILRAAAGLVFALAALLALPANAVTLQIKGTFAALADPGATDALILGLQGGTFHGIYTLPDGTLPGAPGTAIGLTDFRVTARSAAGQRVLAVTSPTDSGGLFFDPFLNGASDGFVFNNGAIQFQVGVPRGFTGTGPIIADAIFTAGPGPLSRLTVTGGTAYVPVPAAGLLVASGLGALLLLGRPKGPREPRHAG